MIPLRETTLLVREVKSRPLLWDTSHPFYKDKLRRAQSWKEIIQAVYPGTVGRVAEGKRLRDLMNRWKSLRDSYSKHLKRVRLYGKDSHMTKPYVFASKLSFLDNYMSSREGGRAHNSNATTEDEDVETNGVDHDEAEEEEDADAEEAGEDPSSAMLDFGCEDETEQELEGIQLHAVKLDPDLMAASGSCATLDAAVALQPPPTAASRESYWTVMHPTRRKRKPKRETHNVEAEQASRRGGERESMPEQDPDVAYFSSLLPTVRGFTEDQKLEFRTEVLLLMRAIKSGAKRSETSPASGSDAPN